MLAGLAPDATRLEASVERARKALREIPGIKLLYKQDSFVLPTEREHFGFKDGISHPAVEGSGIPGSNPQERPLKAGEFVLGYPDEGGSLPVMPSPEVLGRNGTYIVSRKLRQRVAAFRQYLRANSSSPEAEELLAAKFIGRWRSGCPLALSPERDDPARRLQGLPQFVVTRGGEYCFMPGLRALSLVGKPRRIVTDLLPRAVGFPQHWQEEKLGTKRECLSVRPPKPIYCVGRTTAAAPSPSRGARSARRLGGRCS